MEGDREAGRLTADDLAEVGIVGAGLAGTTLAIALKQSGLAVRLYDQPEDQPEDQPNQRHRSETPVLLSANGTRVLHAIGLKEDLAEIAVLPQFSTLRHARTGFLLSQRPLGAFSEARYGAPDILVDGDRLITLLRDTASAEGIPLHSEAAVTTVDAGTACLTLVNDRQIRHQALAVASGIPVAQHAPGIANLLNERDWRDSDDLIAIRAVGVRAEASRDHERFINTWVADGLIAIEKPLPQQSPAMEEQRLALTLLAPAQEHPNRNTSAAELFTRLLERAHPHLRGLIAYPVVERVPQPVADIAEFWYAEKLVLLGGVCHAHPAFPELSPSAALEDAWVLSRMMERWEESPHEGFADYERYRKPRAERLRRHAIAERATLAGQSGVADWQRNLKWSLTSRFLPEIAMQRTDWLYGYDCIKGFA